MSLPDLALAALRRLPAETAHRLTVRALALGLAPVRRRAPDPRLAVRLWGRDFPNPLGLAAGFDKDAEAVPALLGLGFGFVEVGTVTPLAQPGNPRPRLFRLVEDEAVINRMGFNNRGLEAFARRLAARDRALGIVGANLGANKGAPDPLADYVAGIRRVAPLADYLVVNVSSPNTPGLRGLQAAEPLRRLLDAVRRARDEAAERPPLLVKIAPDLAEHEIAAIAEVVRAAGIDGAIVSNTTIARPDTLKSRHRGEPGGLSGRPLLEPSTRVLGALRRALGPAVPLIGVGGVASGRDAYAKIRAGASLVQLYTALVYRGPGLIGQILDELAACLAADGFADIAAAVGADVEGTVAGKPQREAHPSVSS